MFYIPRKADKQQSLQRIHSDSSFKLSNVSHPCIHIVFVKIFSFMWYDMIALYNLTHVGTSVRSFRNRVWRGHCFCIPGRIKNNENLRDIADEWVCFLNYSVIGSLATKPTQQMHSRITHTLFTHWLHYSTNSSKVSFVLCTVLGSRDMAQAQQAWTGRTLIDNSHHPRRLPVTYSASSVTLLEDIFLVPRVLQEPDSRFSNFSIASRAQPSFPWPVWTALRVYSHTHCPSTSPCMVAKIDFQLDWIWCYLGDKPLGTSVRDYLDDVNPMPMMRDHPGGCLS